MAKSRKQATRKRFNHTIHVKRARKATMARHKKFRPIEWATTQASQELYLVTKAIKADYGLNEIQARIPKATQATIPKLNGEI